MCGKLEGNSIEKADESKCDAADKPESERECDGPEDCPAQWFAGPWTECTKKCGGGIRTRKTICLGADGATDISKCDEDKILFASEDCNADPCVDDELLPLDTTSKPLEEDDESEEWCDEDYDESATTEAQDGVVKVTDDSELTSGVEMSSDFSTEASPLTEEMMFSDAAFDETDSSDGTTDSTIEGSGSTPELSENVRFDGSGTDESTESSSSPSSADLTSSSDLDSSSVDSSSDATDDLVSLSSTASSASSASSDADTTASSAAANHR